MLETVPLLWASMLGVACFSLGIIAALSSAERFSLVAIVIVSVPLAVAALMAKERVSDVSTCLLLFFAGACAGLISTALLAPAEFDVTDVGREIYVEGIVRGASKLHTDGLSFTLDIDELRYDGTGDFNGKQLSCMVYGSGAAAPEGARIAVYGVVKRFKRPVAVANAFFAGRRNAGDFRVVVGPEHPLPIILEDGGSLFTNVRRRLATTADNLGFGGYSSYIKAMTIGDTGSLTREMRDDFSRAGIAHLLAVSGLHVGIVLAGLTILLSLTGLNRNLRAVIIVGILILYAGLCGFRPPVTRAALMCTTLLFAPLFGRKQYSENILFVVALVILAFSPLSLFGVSFQLSFAAVWGIIIFNKAIRRLIPCSGFLAYVCGIVSISVIAAVATAPVAAWHFGEIPLFGIFANIVAIPLTFAIVSLGLAAMLIGAFMPFFAALAVFLGFCASELISLLMLVAALFRSLPGATVVIGQLSFYVVTGVFAWGYVVSRSAGREGFKKIALYAPLLFLLFHVWQPFFPAIAADSSAGRLVFFDVGQGDAAFIQTAGGATFLIDCGPAYGDYDSGSAMILPSLRNMGVDHLDGVFVSHLHDDHTGGLASVLDALPVSHVYCREQIAASLARKLGRDTSGLALGDSLTFDGGGCLVLSPSDDFETGRDSDENDRSLVLLFYVGDERIIFAGDIGPSAQRRLSSWGDRIQADILKLPHHGAGGLERSFVTSVSPEKAIVSCGLDNRFGHPHPETVSLLETAGVAIWRTDLSGAYITSLSGDSNFKR